MNILIAYDSYFGNTQQVAAYYKKELETEHFVTLMNVKEIVKANIEQFEILVLGSPTRAFNMSPNVKNLIKNKQFVFEKKHAFVFDTRSFIKEGELRFLVKMMKWFGFAAEKMEKQLVKRGADIIMPHKYYYVLDKDGPLELGIQDKITKDCKELKRKIKELA